MSAVAQRASPLQIQAERSRRSLRYFLEHAWPIVEPTTPMYPNWHIDTMCQHLEAVTAGTIRRLIINVPPGTGKSLIVSVIWPVWEWTRAASLRIFAASYAEDLSVRDQLKARDIVQSDWFRAAFPHVALRSDQNRKTRMDTTASGWRIASSVGGVGTGEHPDRIIIDDPHNTKQAESDTQRADVLNWYDRTISTRGITRGSRHVLVMQRLHEDDLSGHLLAKGGWAHLCIPMRREPTTAPPTPIGFVDPRADAELLWPAVLPEEKLARLEIDLGSLGVAGQLQQHPAPPGGAIVHRAWLRYWRELPSDLDDWLISIDCTYKELKDNDFVAAGVFAKKGTAKYLVHRVKERLDFPGTCAMIKSLSAQYPQALLKLVEDAANGPAVIQSLKSTIDGLVAVTPMGSKIARIAACTPTMEAGNFYVPDPTLAPWVEDYIGELTMFPNAAHDDQVDMTSQALNRWQADTRIEYGGPVGVERSSPGPRL